VGHCKDTKRPEGRNHVVSSWDFGTLGLREMSCIDNKEEFSVKVSKLLLACVLDACVLDEY
jgi:hypothetical protein